MFLELAEDDDPYFDWLAFHEEKRQANVAPAKIAKLQAAANEARGRPEVKEAASKRMRRQMQDPEYLAKLQEARDQLWADSGQRVRHAEHNRRIAAARRLTPEELAYREYLRDQARIEREAERAAERIRREAAKPPPMPQEQRQQLAREALARYWTPERREENVRVSRERQATYWTPERREEARRQASTPEAIERSRRAAEKRWES
jgi:hypothetical protein